MNNVGAASFSGAELETLVLGVRRATRGFVTNFFLSPSQYDSWIERGLHLLAADASYVLLALPEESCIRLFFAGSADDLKTQIGTMEVEQKLPWVVDIVGRGGTTQQINQTFTENGFRPHLRLLRLSRMGSYSFPLAQSTEYLCRPPDFGDVSGIQQLLRDHFDPYADRFPGLLEMNDAIKAGDIQVVPGNGNLAGFLWHEKTGTTAHVRYWGVNGEFQGRGIGGLLMRQYFKLTSDCHRHVLWMRENNATALSCYTHYGYQPDGLEDQIMVREE
jgi:ribosomal protein S18 acetylase RimI-like enzyme